MSQHNRLWNCNIDMCCLENLCYTLRHTMKLAYFFWFFQEICVILRIIYTVVNAFFQFHKMYKYADFQSNFFFNSSVGKASTLSAEDSVFDPRCRVIPSTYLYEWYQLLPGLVLSIERLGLASSLEKQETHDYGFHQELGVGNDKCKLLDLVLQSTTSKQFFLKQLKSFRMKYHSCVIWKVYMY